MKIEQLVASLQPYLSGEIPPPPGSEAETYAPSPHAIDSAHHTGGITDARHGVRTLANAHAHSHLSGVGSSDHHVQTAITAGAGLTGGGAGAGVSLAVGAGTLITVGADDVGITPGAADYGFIGSTTTPWTAGWKSISQLAGNGLTHTAGALAVGVSGLGLGVGADAVTLASSSNPGAAASILASDADGYLRLVRLGIGVNPDYPLHVVGAARIDGDLTFVGAQSILTTADSLTLAPAADLDLTPGGNARVRLTSGVRIQSDNYVSQTTGWATSYAGGGDFRYLYADELHAKAFIADLEQALIGGQIICKSVAEIAIDFTIPTAGGGLRLTLKDLPTMPNVALFQSGDLVRVRQFTRTAGSLSIANCWGVVTGYTDDTDGTQYWEFTRSAAPNAGTAVAGTTVPAGSLALDYGTTGNGFYEVNAIDGAWAENSPYAQIVSWATHPATGQTVRTRLGNLKGIFNVTNEYGLYAGAGVTDSDQYLRVSNTAVEAHNLPIKMYDGASATIALNPTLLSFAMGATLPVGVAGNDGIWMGKDSIYKFRVGDADGERLLWDGNDLYVMTNDSNYIKMTGSSMEFYAGGIKVINVANTPAVTIGEVGASKNNVLITSGVFALRNNTIERIAMSAAGVLTINDSEGAAVITLDASTGAEITKKLTMPGASSAIAIGTTPPTSATAGTGIWIDRTGLYGLNANVQQTYINSTGQLLAGAGNVVLDTNGVQINLTTVTAPNTIHWGAFDAIPGIHLAGQTVNTNNILLYIGARAAATYPATITLSAYSNTGTLAALHVVSDSNSTIPAYIQATVPVYMDLGLNVGTATGAGTGQARLTGAANQILLTGTSTEVDIRYLPPSNHGWQVGVGVTATGFQFYEEGPNVSQLTIAEGGNVTIRTLAGTGNRPVYADANGKLYC